MASDHNFHFDGGELFSKIGASWFVSYAYFLYIDGNHRNWEIVKTSSTRISKFNNTKEYHMYWLQQVEDMNPLNLNKNTIGLSAEEVKEMADDLLCVLPLEAEKQCL